MIKCGDIADFMERMAPGWLAESYDNVGLLLGGRSKRVDSLLVCLDVNGLTAGYAVKNGIDMILSHHPFIFKGIKRIEADGVRGGILYSLIKNDVCVYAAHTNLDTAEGGVNDMLAASLGLEEITHLKRHREDKLFKIAVFVPVESLTPVSRAMTGAGAGCIGNYSDCTFRMEGKGTFRPLDNTNPYIGTKGLLEEVAEYKLETVVPSSRLSAVVAAMIEAHPYEEVAYDLYPLENRGLQYGLGRVGTLREETDLEMFADHVKEKLDTPFVRIVSDNGVKKIKKAAVFCGSFDGDWKAVADSGADVLVTGDIKYHQATDALEAGLCVVDAGHFPTERIFIPAMAARLAEKFKSLNVIAYNQEKDPFKYY